MKAKILVIEDTENVRENIAEILESEEFDVQAAENGEIGIELAKKYQPDLILCDIMMPGIDGYEVIRQLRENDPTATTPFIFLTAKGTVDNIREGMLLGADDYIPKPFTIDQLLNAVNTRLDRIHKFQEKADETVKTLTHKIGLPFASDLKEPMKTIVGFSEMIATGYPNMEKQEIVDFVDLIHKAGLKLKNTVSKTMNYYRLEALELKTEELATLKESRSEEPDIIIENSARETTGSAKREGDLMLSLSGKAPVKMPSDFLSMLTNELVENACKFSTRKTGIKVISIVKDGRFQLTIEDDGIGMNQEQISKIGAFISYEEREDSDNGLGLGLNNAKKVVELFDGTFAINSSPNQGTIVTITLPTA